MSAPRRLLVPDAVWQTTVELLAPYAAARVEAGLYWYGTRTETAAVVAQVGMPGQHNRSRNFEVGPDNLATLVRAVPDPLVAVAALHTHPGVDTRHSTYDDARAISRKVLSLVLPHYGAGAALRDAGVHEWTGHGWVALAPSEAQDRLALIPALIDTRR